MSTARDSTSQPARHLVLLGAGAGHRRLVRQLARHRLPANLPTTWLVEAESLLPLDQLAPCIAGEVDWAAAELELAPLAAAAGLRLLVRRTARIDALTRSIELDRQERLAFDGLSIDPEPVQERSEMERRRPGAREHALFASPPASLAGLWPRVRALPSESLRSAAVIGNSPLALELAFGLRSARPASAITLVTAGSELLPHASSAARVALAKALRRAAIDVLPDDAVGMEPGALRLASGAVLRCDMPVIADGFGDPPWWAASGLSPRPGASDSIAPTLALAPGTPVFTLPPSASPTLIGRHRANLVRIAGEKPLRPVGQAGRSWQALWTAPGQALALGRGWQMTGPLASWLLHWQRR